MTELQIYLLIAPFVLLALCGGLAVYARRDADRAAGHAPARHNPAE